VRLSFSLPRRAGERATSERLTKMTLRNRPTRRTSFGRQRSTRRSLSCTSPCTTSAARQRLERRRRRRPCRRARQRELRLGRRTAPSCRRRGSSARSTRTASPSSSSCVLLSSLYLSLSTRARALTPPDFSLSLTPPARSPAGQPSDRALQRLALDAVRLGRARARRRDRLRGVRVRRRVGAERDEGQAWVARVVHRVAASFWCFLAKCALIETSSMQRTREKGTAQCG